MSPPVPRVSEVTEYWSCCAHAAWKGDTKCAFCEKTGVRMVRAADYHALRSLLASSREALESIAANTCCGPCQEAALVARAQLRALAKEITT
jgi:hypothetical protein